MKGTNMGYSTSFEGKLKLNRQLTLDEYNEYKIMLDTRHDDKVMPDYYLQWQITKDGRYLEWDGGEKFYNYVDWLEWLTENWFAPKDVVLNGEIKWYGEDRTDTGIIIVKDNKVTAKEGEWRFRAEEVEGGEKLLEKLEDARREYFDYFHDHRPLVAETLGNVGVENAEEISQNEVIDIEHLTKVMESLAEAVGENEYHDMYYIAGLIRGMEKALEIVK